MPMRAPRPSLRLSTLVGLVPLVLAGCKEKAPVAPPPPEVSVVTIEPRVIDAEYEFVGQAEASKRVEVRSAVPGIIVERPYVEGTDVPKGALLYRIDPTTYEATYRSAQARLSEARARLENAERNLGRLRPLLAENAVAQKDVDDAATEAASARAAVDDAQAAVDRAKKDYDDTWIRAEIPGRAGRALMVLGARVTGPADLLTVVEQVNPIYVNFSPSDLQLLQWRRDIAEGRIVPNPQQEVEVTLADGSTFPFRGRLNFADLAIQPQTGTMQLRAELRNPSAALLPGQFVRVRMLGVTRKGAILVPQRAVQTGIGGAYVYVVDSAGKATARTVTTSSSVGGEYVVDTGLAPGDRVVVDGIQRVVAGQPVRVAEAAPAGRLTAGGDTAGATR